MWFDAFVDFVMVLRDHLKGQGGGGGSRFVFRISHYLGPFRSASFGDFFIFPLLANKRFSRVHRGRPQVCQSVHSQHPY